MFHAHLQGEGSDTGDREILSTVKESEAEKVHCRLPRPKQMRLNLTQSGLHLEKGLSEVCYICIWQLSTFSNILFPFLYDNKVMLTEKMKEDLVEQSILFKTPNLSEFQKKVNSAAAELALCEPSLVRKGNRGVLLERARRKALSSRRGSRVPRCMECSVSLLHPQSEQILMKKSVLSD